LDIPDSRPEVIPTAVEGSGCEYYPRKVPGRMSRLRFASLDMTNGLEQALRLRFCGDCGFSCIRRLTAGESEVTIRGPIKGIGWYAYYWSCVR